MHVPLDRRLGLPEAVALGVGSMVGAGIVGVMGPATAAAGSALPLALALAALVAWCNASSSAQLAAQHPSAGGSYHYGRVRLGPWWGFAAGWCFVVGKTASCAAMALVLAAHVAPDGWERPVAVAAVVALTAVNLRGITRTARLTLVLAVVTCGGLLVTLVAVRPGSGSPGLPALGADASVGGVLSGAGLLFFAFAGYARVATLGEEVRDPARTIPRAVTIALAVTLLLYAAVAATLLATLGVERLAASETPLLDAAEERAGWVVPVVLGVAATATLGALLALVAGVSRTVLAMAREGDLPRRLDAVHPVHRVPHRAEVAVGLVVCLVVCVGDVREVVGFSSFGVLLYYAVTNAAALTQDAGHRRTPRAVAVLGLVGCLVLVAALPVASVLVGLVVLVAGLAGRAVLRR